MSQYGLKVGITLMSLLRLAVEPIYEEFERVLDAVHLLTRSLLELRVDEQRHERVPETGLHASTKVPRLAPP
jgi:hypothetical protein